MSANLWNGHRRDFYLPIITKVVPQLDRNLSINQGIYPDLLKVSKVIALFKKGDRLIPKIYRPISLLDIFDKIFERILHTRFASFLNKIKAFFEFQFGFRAGHSTILALINIVDEIKKRASFTNSLPK